MLLFLLSPSQAGLEHLQQEALPSLILQGTGAFLQQTVGKESSVSGQPEESSDSELWGVNSAPEM